MTQQEKRLLERAEKLRSRMIQAKSWLEHGDPQKALELIKATLDADG